MIKRKGKGKEKRSDPHCKSFKQPSGLSGFLINMEKGDGCLKRSVRILNDCLDTKHSPRSPEGSIHSKSPHPPPLPKLKYQAYKAPHSPPKHHPNPHTPAPPASTCSSPPSKAHTSVHPPLNAYLRSCTTPPFPTSPPACPASRRSEGPKIRSRACSAASAPRLGGFCRRRAIGMRGRWAPRSIF